MLFEDLVNVPVHSLDIETTGFHHNENKIWSVGLAASDPNKSMERFIGGIVAASSTDPMKDFLEVTKQDGSEAFSDKQMARKSFDPYIENFKQGHLTNVSSALNEVGQILADSPGILLIQNVGFESSAFKAALSKQGNEQNLPLSDKINFTDKVFGTQTSASPIVVSPEIAEARVKFNAAVNNQMRLSKESKDVSLRHASSAKLKESTLELEKVISKTVRDNLGKAIPVSTTLDLMDISRMYLADLHLAGELDQGFLKTGTKVEFLAKEILGVDEQHTALLDAEQQSDIFKKLNERRYNLAKNGLSADDKKFAAKVSDPATDAKIFLSGITENLQKSPTDISNKKLSETFDGILSRRVNIPSGDFSRKSFTDKILKDHADGTSIEDLVKQVSKESENLDISKYPVSTEPPSGRGILDSFKGSSKKTKLLVGAGALIGAGLLSSGPRRDIEEPRREQQRGAYSELYENVYAGQAYADWQERNNSHRMM